MLHFSVLHSFHVLLFLSVFMFSSCYTFFMLHALFSCLAISKLHFFVLFILDFFHFALFSCCFYLSCCTIFMLLLSFVLHYFHFKLSSCCIIFILYCRAWIFSEQVFCKKTLNRLPVFHMLCKTCNLEILLKHLLPKSCSCSFFQTPRWSAFVLQTCCSKKRMKAPIKRDRYIVIGIQIDGKKISTLCKVSFNQHSLKSLWKISRINWWWRSFFLKALVWVLYFFILGPPSRSISGICPNFQMPLAR